MSARILVGDVRERLAEMPDASVHCCVTSPPYYGLRNYGVAGQIGLEPTLAEYIATMVGVFREVRRVLRDDGTLWLNIGDSYASAWPAPNTRRNIVGNPMAGGKRGPQRQSKLSGTLKEKDLMMVPARLAIGLCDDGWWLRSDIIWHKRAPMPESVTDRPTSAHEHIFLLTKAARYFYDADAVAEQVSESSVDRLSQPTIDQQEGSHRANGGMKSNGTMKAVGSTTTRNQRNVWTLSPESFAQAHFATFPTELPRRCIKAGTSEKGACSACGTPWRRVVERTGERETHGTNLSSASREHRPSNHPGASANSVLRTGRVGVYETTGWVPGCACAADVVPCTVLDPFLGSGTTLLVADQLDRNGIGVELNSDYALMAERRIRGDAPLFADVERIA